MFEKTYSGFSLLGKPDGGGALLCFVISIFGIAAAESIRRRFGHERKKERKKEALILGAKFLGGERRRKNSQR